MTRREAVAAGRIERVLHGGARHRYARAAGHCEAASYSANVTRREAVAAGEIGRVLHGGARHRYENKEVLPTEVSSTS